MKTRTPTPQGLPGLAPDPIPEPGGRKSEMVRGIQGFDAQNQALSPMATETDGDTATYGGTWSTSKYEPYAQDGLRGAAIVIHFSPNASVDATAIGLTQTVKVTRSDASGSKSEFGGDKQREARALDATESEPGEVGTNLDKAAGQSSPYFADNGASWTGAQAKAVAKTYGGADLSSAALRQMKAARQAKPRSTFGKRTGDTSVEATLHDRSKQSWQKGETLEADFETAAVAKSGAQSGVYYGSITWGYSVAADGDVKTKPIAIKHMGTPSETFAKSAKKWNEAEGYTLNRHFDRGAVRRGITPALMGKSGGNPRYDRWARSEGVTSDWDTIPVSVTANEKLPVADVKSPDAKPVDTAARIAELEAMKLAHKDDPTLIANINYELKALASSR